MIDLINYQTEAFASKLFCLYTASKVSKCGDFSGPYLDTFHVVLGLARLTENSFSVNIYTINE